MHEPILWKSNPAAIAAEREGRKRKMEQMAKYNRLNGQTLNAQQLKDYVLDGLKRNLQEKAPPGWSGTVAAMKRHKELRNPYALAWSMKKKGDTPHYKAQPGNDSTSDAEPKKKKKYDEWLKVRDNQLYNKVYRSED